MLVGMNNDGSMERTYNPRPHSQPSLDECTPHTWDEEASLYTQSPDGDNDGKAKQRDIRTFVSLHSGSVDYPQ
jgi:hypothetical protein